MLVVNKMIQIENELKLFASIFFAFISLHAEDMQKQDTSLVWAGFWAPKYGKHSLFE